MTNETTVPSKNFLLGPLKIAVNVPCTKKQIVFNLLHTFLCDGDVVPIKADVSGQYDFH